MTVMYGVLEREYLQIAQRDFDPETTLVVLDGLQHAFSDDELAGFETLMDTFFAATRDTLDHLFLEYRDDERRHPLLFQPEVIAIYERLRTHQERLYEVWGTHVQFPVETLEALQVVLGVS